VATAAHCKSNKRTCQGAIWTTLFEKIREVHNGCVLLQFKQQPLSERLVALRQDQTFARCIKQKTRIMDAEQQSSQVAQELAPELMFFKKAEKRSAKAILSRSYARQKFS